MKKRIKLPWRRSSADENSGSEAAIENSASVEKDEAASAADGDGDGEIFNENSAGDDLAEADSVGDDTVGDESDNEASDGGREMSDIERILLQSGFAEPDNGGDDDGDVFDASALPGGIVVLTDEDEADSDEMDVAIPDDISGDEISISDVDLPEYVDSDVSDYSDEDDEDSEDSEGGGESSSGESSGFDAYPGLTAYMSENVSDTGEDGSKDMNLRIAFGLDNDEDGSGGATKKLGDKFESDIRASRRAPRHYEFTDPSQARDIAEEFKRKCTIVNVRLFFAAVVTVLLVIYENLPLITGAVTGTPKQFAGILDPVVYPVIYSMVSLQLLIIVAALALPELIHGLNRLLHGAPTPESFALVILAAAVVSTSITAADASVLYEISLYNGAASLSLVLAVAYSRLCVKRNMLAFFVAGSRRKKYAMSSIIDDEISAPAEDDEYGEFYDVMKIERADFIDGFFSRVEAPDKMASAFISGVLGISVAAAIVFGVYAAKDGRSAASVAQTIYTTLISMLPLSACLVFSYPFYRASVAASELDSAIIGEISVNEYSSASMVTLDDSNVFPSFGVKVQNIRIYNNARIDRVLYYASSIFKKAGGPLGDVFEIATVEMGLSDDVEILDAGKGYLAARVDGVNIAFGSFSALSARGFSIDEGVAEDDVDLSDELSIMYMFREKVLVSKMYIKYVLDGDFESTLSNFKDYGMYICVRTYDPNIDEEMISSKLEMKNPPLRVVKYRSENEAASHSDRVDSGMVTFGSPKSLVELLPFCDRVIHTKRTCCALCVMSVVISVMLLAIFSMSDSMSYVNSLYISLYHAAWLIPAYLASKIFVR